MTAPSPDPRVEEVERRYVTDADFHARVDVGVRAAQEFRQSWRGGPDERFHTMQIALAFAATDAATDTVQVPRDAVGELRTRLAALSVMLPNAPWVADLLCRFPDPDTGTR